ncbi:MAG: 2-succinyl-5-enolpyruvyl-6-hydroxy-3-cyclohexene-1-carboxylic-acid synthase, partial [Actinomycetota bacterium]
NFLPAVAEANLSAVPMIVLTADRPEELRGVGAPQTIDQIELFGSHAVWFHDPDVADAASAEQWRPLADAAVDHAAAGPVHLNLPFREPLVGRARPLPDAGPSTFAPAVDHGPPIELVPDGFDRQRGVILAGGRSGVARADVIALHELTEWPIIADAQSGLRQHPGVITTADALLRHARFAADHAPELVVRVGRPSSSKVLARWAAAGDPLVVQVGGPGIIDPDHNVAARCSIEALLAARPAGARGTTWLRRWRHADERAANAIAAELDTEEISEAGVARTVAEHSPVGSLVTVSSSMPVRDLEWFGGRAASAHANRGANGIDGVLSTGLGRTLAAAGTVSGVVLIGDLAFVHDSNALVSLATRSVDLRIVVVDNDGGGIFSFLPQSAELDPARFEQLFGTPLGVDVLALARSCGVDAVDVTTRQELIDRLAMPGPWVVRAKSDRRANVHDHRRLDDAVIRALDA